MVDEIIAPIKCPRCVFKTPEDLPKSVALAIFTAHVTEHTAPPAAPTTAQARSGPKLERPKVEMGISMEEWNVFKRRWDAYVIGSGLDADTCTSQLFDCTGEELGNTILKSKSTILSGTTKDLLATMKDLAVIAVAPGVVRAELMQMHQDRDESFRTFAAKVRGKAETCGYVNHECEKKCDFTQSMVNDVLVAGIYDLDIRREVLGIDKVLQKSTNEIISLIETRETARNALPPSAAAMSTFKKNQRGAKGQNREPPPVAPPPITSQTAPCPGCGKTFSLYTEGSSGWNTKPHEQCIACFRKLRKNRRRNPNNDGNGSQDNAEVGGMFAQIATLGASDAEPDAVTPTNLRDVDSCESIPSPTLVNPHSAPEISVISETAPRRTIPLPHQIFTKGQWRRARFEKHPKVKLTITVDPQDYKDFGARCPEAPASSTEAITDSGAQLNLWEYAECMSAGFTPDDIIPVSMGLEAANKSPITIEGALLLRLTGTSPTGEVFSCAALVYISKQAHGFYLSLESMMDLCIVPRDFPNIGAASSQTAANASCSTSTENKVCEDCSQFVRTAVPERPKELPFDAIPENNVKMEQWLLNHFASSTFNQCPHQPLPEMAGPPIEIHLKDGATPKACHTPATVPLNLQGEFQECLAKLRSRDVIEPVPHGEPVTWCSRCVPTTKSNGKMRLTVDFSALNKCCSRETHYVEPPFRVVRRIPGNTWKTVTDMSDGYHLVPLRTSDRHLTTFITPYGRERFKRAPQGFVGSGDGFNRRADEILVDMVRKERVVDDVCHYDTELEEHWWRTIDYLILMGQSGVILNPDKFRFARRSVDFAGFRVSETTVEPLPKYLDAIRDFPTPTSVTDIRSWFGLVNQVSHYAQLRELMTPFRQFRSSNCTFFWNEELDSAFRHSKKEIIAAIQDGVEIFDPMRRTCLRTDWSKRGMGYFLLQKYCNCPDETPDCCENGWRTILAGSRFLQPAEERYAPIEGEALAVAWGLEQTRYFTMGCSDLIIVTDHKPLVKIFTDKALDEITNYRMFSIKQRTLPWMFKIFHRPGKTNSAADAISRHPNENESSEFKASINALLIGQRISDTVTVASIRCNFQSLSWSTLAEETENDPITRRVREILSGAQATNNTADVSSYWPLRHDLRVIEGVIIYRNRIVIPSSLRACVLEHLHSGHQGVSAMCSRARSLVFWPGITGDIHLTRDRCVPCNRNAPSQTAPPASEPSFPSTPFEMVFADYFEFSGHHYLVAGDRLSGWVEVFRAPHHSALAGAQGLISSLRSLFATFGVPEEISSDGGKEFVAAETKSFLTKWNVSHRKSSAHFPQSNGRAEVAVKKCKRLLMNNIGPHGSLNNDNFLRAILAIRNTPDPDCKISPAEILFGRPLRDAFSFVNRLNKFDNPTIRATWKEAWSLKEEAMRTRYTRTMESLNHNARDLPPLKEGDRVFVQNQRGSHPTKWDSSGLVMDVGKHDQYAVKIDGSGRLTTRNRRFLRKYTPATLDIPQLPPIRVTSDTVHQQPPEATAPEPQTVQGTDMIDVASSVQLHPAVTPPETPPHQAENASDPRDDPPTPPPSVPTQKPRTSNRARIPRKSYVPESGTWE